MMKHSLCWEEFTSSLIFCRYYLPEEKKRNDIPDEYDEVDEVADGL